MYDQGNYFPLRQVSTIATNGTAFTSYMTANSGTLWLDTSSNALHYNLDFDKFDQRSKLRKEIDEILELE